MRKGDSPLFAGGGPAERTPTSRALSARRASPSLISARKASASSVARTSTVPRPRSLSASARRRSVRMSSRLSGSKVKIWLRLSSGALTAKNGFCVVAPIRMIRPSSTSGSSTSCCGLVEAVQLIHEEDGAAAGFFQLGAGLVEDFAHLLGAGGDGVERAEPALRLVGDDLGERRFAGAGRAIEDRGAKPIGLKQPAQQLAFAEETAAGRRTHPGCAAAAERRAAGPCAGWPRARPGTSRRPSSAAWPYGYSPSCR